MIGASKFISTDGSCMNRMVLSVFNECIEFPSDISKMSLLSEQSSGLNMVQLHQQDL